MRCAKTRPKAQLVSAKPHWPLGIDENNFGLRGFRFQPALRVRWTMQRIFDSPEGKARVREGNIKLVGAIYQIKSGRVRFLD
jgi:carbonic anhydrase